ncbi:MAG: hypothetical protein AAF471_00025 [Myxococcota bacterium]
MRILWTLATIVLAGSFAQAAEFSEKKEIDCERQILSVKDLIEKKDLKNAMEKIREYLNVCHKDPENNSILQHIIMEVMKYNKEYVYKSNKEIQIIEELTAHYISQKKDDILVGRLLKLAMKKKDIKMIRLLSKVADKKLINTAMVLFFENITFLPTEELSYTSRDHEKWGKEIFYMLLEKYNSLHLDNDKSLEENLKYFLEASNFNEKKRSLFEKLLRSYQNENNHVSDE